MVHLGSVLGAVLAGVHAYQAGSDAASLAFRLVLMAIAGFGVYAVLVRILDLLFPRPPAPQLVRVHDRSRKVMRP
jgi:hypothetical protein